MDPFCVGLDPVVVRLAADVPDDPVVPVPVNPSADVTVVIAAGPLTGNKV